MHCFLKAWKRAFPRGSGPLGSGPTGPGSGYSSMPKKVGKNSTTDLFRCNRSGTYKPRGTGKRAMKQQGTSKIDRHCTAFIKVVTPIDNENITLEVCLGHTGHSQKIGFLRIPDKLRQDIAGKLAKGVKIETILDDIRNSACDGIFRGPL